MNILTLKSSFLHLSKWTGLFVLSRYFTRRGLRILCYHGFAISDESEFRPKLFITSATFRRRLEYLKRKRYPVMCLTDALTSLQKGLLRDCSSVITIDDGFFSSYLACELLKRFSYPATIYVTSYYCGKGVPIYRLVVQYIFWKTRRLHVRLAEIVPEWSGECSLAADNEKTNLMWKIIHFGEKLSSEEERTLMSRRLSDLFEVDLEPVNSKRLLSLINFVEIRSLVSQGFDIQLHTHRHRELSNEAEAFSEVRDNRDVLEPLVGKRLEHLCYPSGIWTEKLWEGLVKLGIKSACTCEPGLNFQDTPLLCLNRFLDGEHIAQIEFESELAGYSELLRQLRKQTKKVSRYLLSRCPSNC